MTLFTASTYSSNLPGCGVKGDPEHLTPLHLLLPHHHLRWMDHHSLLEAMVGPHSHICADLQRSVPIHLVVCISVNILVDFLTPLS